MPRTMVAQTVTRTASGNEAADCALRKKHLTGSTLIKKPACSKDQPSFALTQSYSVKP